MTPRKPGSTWAATNKVRVERLMAAGLMAERGPRVIELAKANGSWTIVDSVERLEVPDDLAARSSTPCRRALASSTLSRTPRGSAGFPPPTIGQGAGAMGPSAMEIHRGPPRAAGPWPAGTRLPDAGRAERMGNFCGRCPPPGCCSSRAEHLAMGHVEGLDGRREMLSALVLQTVARSQQHKRGGLRPGRWTDPLIHIYLTWSPPASSSASRGASGGTGPTELMLPLPDAAAPQGAPLRLITATGAVAAYTEALTCARPSSPHRPGRRALPVAWQCVAVGFAAMAMSSGRPSLGSRGSVVSGNAGSDTVGSGRTVRS